MAQKKLQRFADIKTFSNVLEYPQEMQGNWHSFFKNENSIVLELACGKGEYTVELAKLWQNQNYIGVDVKGNRLWKGAADALHLNLQNAAFLRTQIGLINSYFGKDEVAEIWITFPDPQLRISKQKKRLTHPRFLFLYQQFLSPDGCVHLKTDSPALYLFTKKVIDVYNLTLQHDIDDVYAGKNIMPELQIKTHYEKLDIAQSGRIFYLCFCLNNDVSVDKEEELKQWEYEKADGR
ncbi:MAG: tRNA (guanosine(46)-N7)-methyltransferase TrmB [Bacteroidota bacterium]|nr:tRNA (guanosine(46)-N7)-methyltransferase TrmB [Bacteroidota bacterium]